MSIDWISFTPWISLFAGALIGLAVSVFVLANGRIAGISGLLAGVLQPGSEGWSDKALVLLGLLVGVGTRYASGCTSGHGVCGMSRLSPRSIVATLCFMASGFATVYVSRHVLGA